MGNDLLIVGAVTTMNTSHIALLIDVFTPTMGSDHTRYSTSFKNSTLPPFAVSRLQEARDAPGAFLLALDTFPT